MHTNLDLFIIVIISLCCVGIFKLQSVLTPLRYFSNADLVIQGSFMPLQIITRYVLIGVFSITLQVTFGVNNNLILFGNLLGSFLIVWPTLLSPKFSYNESYISKKNKMLIYILHIFFVATTGFATYMSLMLISLFEGNITDYMFNILFPGVSIVFGEYIKRKLSKNIIITREKDEEEYKDVVEKD